MKENTIKSLITLAYVFLAVVAFFPLGVIAEPNSTALAKVIDARNDLRTHLTHIRSRSVEFRETFDLDGIFVSERDRKFFRSSLEELKAKSSYSFEEAMNKLGEVALEVQKCNGSVTPVDPCAGIPPKFQCEACTYPGNRTCNSISCTGVIISTVTQNCELDSTKFKCSSCSFYSKNGRFTGGYSLYYQSMPVGVVERFEDTFNSTKECDRARTGDPRCK